MDTWHLRPPSELSLADFHVVINDGTVQFMNDSWRSTDFTWSFGDGGNSTDENPIHTYAMDGTYAVELIASSPCGDDTLTIDIIIDILSIGESSENVFMKRNLGNGMYELSGINNINVNEIKLMDATGKTLNTNDHLRFHEHAIDIDLSRLADGMYFLRFTTELEEITIDLLKTR